MGAQLENGVKLTLAASFPPPEPTIANGSATELPTDLELLQGVHQHLLGQARSLAAAGEEHSGYLSRVAASAIAIVARGLEDRASVLAHEKALLVRHIAGTSGIAGTVSGADVSTCAA